MKPNPRRVAPDSNATELPLRMTGTDTVSGAVPGAVTGDIGLHRTALKYTLGIFGGTSGNATESLEMKQAGAFPRRSASSCTSEGAGDRTQDPQIKSLLLYQLSYAFKFRIGASTPIL